MSYTTPQWGLLAEGDFASGDIAFESGHELSGAKSLERVVEDDFWNALAAGPAGELHDQYLELYPDGAYADLARQRVSADSN